MNLIDIIKESWNWSGIQPEAIVGENEFGNLIIRDIYGAYWRLCPEDIYCKQVAENREALDALTHNQEFLTDWYMVALVEQAQAALGPLSPGHKYHLVIPGILGGAYSVENIRILPQFEQLRFCGDIGRQIDTLPDGAKIELKLGD